jgi:hypothetical protein
MVWVDSGRWNMFIGSAERYGEHYKVVRMFFEEHEPVVVAKYMTLAEAQEWCRDPETSSSTATSAEAVARTEKYGAWFDGYDEA